MFCQKCGAEIPDSSVFCNVCGAKQEEIKKVEIPAEPKEMPKEPEEISVSPKKKANPKIIFAVAIVAVLAVIIFAFASPTLFASNETKEKIEKLEYSISEIGEIEATEDCGEKIAKAEKLRGELDEKYYSQIPNFEELEHAREDYDIARANAAKQAIQNIGSVTAQAGKRIAKAREVYNALENDAQKLLVTNYSRLVEAEAELKLKIKEEEYKKTEEYVKAEEERKELEKKEKELKAKESVEDVIRINYVGMSNHDSVGGFDVYINYINNSEKTIKYATFGIKFYNDVGDMVVCTIKRDLVNYMQDTGPYEKGEGLQGKGWKWGKYYNWTATSVKLVSVSIEYTDGTTRNLSTDEVAAAQY